jgi:hypothetical protein
MISRSPSRASRSTLRQSPHAHRRGNHDTSGQHEESRQEESSLMSNPPRVLQKYFSFSRDKRIDPEESLPAFPPEL